MYGTVKSPIFGINMRIWQTLGIIGVQHRKRSLIFFIVPLLQNIFQLCNVLKNWRDTNVLVIGMFMTVILFNTILRFLSVRQNEQKFNKLLKLVSQWFQELQRQNDRNAKRILHKMVAQADLLSKFALGFATCGAVLTTLMPIVQRKRIHPHEIYIPYIDTLASPTFELVYALQAFGVMPFITLIYAVYLNFFICWLMFGIAVLKHLCLKLSAINLCKTQKQMDLALRDCIIYHQRIMSFISDLNQLVSRVCLIEFAMYSVMICVLLLFFAWSDSTIFKVMAFVYILSIIYALFLQYWFTQKLSDQSLEVANEAYNTSWALGSRSFRKSISIMIARSQQPLEISVGGMYPMNLNTLQALLNASYSYFTLLIGANTV